MAGASHWLGAIRRTFSKSLCKSVSVLDHTNLIHNVPFEEDTAASAAAVTKGTVCREDERNWKAERVLTIQDLAAIKIQACFRGHLARRAFRALRSLVKLQALARGVCVRREARIAIQCMQAMVRLQGKIRTRQLLSSSGDRDPAQVMCTGR